MKVHTLIGLPCIALSLMVATYSCGDHHDIETDCSGEELAGDMLMYIDGEKYESYSYTFEDNHLTIEGVYYLSKYCMVQHLLFMDIPFREGTFRGASQIDSLQLFAKPILEYVDYDVFLAEYSIPEGKENGYIYLSKYADATKNRQGIFSFTLYKAEAWVNNAPDSLVVYGSFDAYFQK